MATAAELLSRTTAEVDNTLVIDNYLRTIAIPKSVTNLGVEHDDDVLRLDFKMPRYLEDTDLSKFSIRINYLNAKGEGDVYTVNDKVVGTDSITFSWLVGPTATAYKGDTKFIVCMTIVNSDGYIEKEYNTTVASLPVLEGLEVDEQIVTAYSDIIEQWKRELFGIGDTEEASMRAVSQEEQKNITEKGREVLATIPEEYQETAEAAQEGIRTKADAITCTAQGNVVTVSDSSDDHLRGLRVFGKTTQVTTTGKNLLSPFTKGTAISTTNGSEYASSASAITDFIPVDFTTNPKYCLSGMLNTLYSFVAAYNADHEFLGRCSASSYSEIVLASTYFTGGTAVGTGDIAYLRVSTYENKAAVDGSISDIDNMKAQLEVGSVATEYEPYSGCVVSPSPDWHQPLDSLGDMNFMVAGKNLLKITTGGVATGVTETVSNGLVSFSGTAIGSGGRVLWKRSDEVVLYPGTYTLRAIIPSGTAPTPCLSRTGSHTLVANGQHITFTLEETTTVFLGFNYIIDRVYDATDVAVQLEVGSNATDYEPRANLQTMTVTGHTLHGVPVTTDGNYTDANGQQWICDEIDFERGVLVQRIGVATFTNAFEYVNASSVDGSGVFYAGLSGYDPTNYNLGMLSTHFRFAGYDTHNSGAVGHLSAGEFSYIRNTSAGARIYFAVAGITSKEEANDWLATNKPVVYYPLKTPVETALTAEEIESFKAVYSNYPNTTVSNDVGAWMELKYNVDTEIWINDRITETNYYVEVTSNINGVYKADKTLSDIRAADNNPITCRLTIDGGYTPIRLPLSFLNTSVAIFSGMYQGRIYTVTITEDSVKVEVDANATSEITLKDNVTGETYTLYMNDADLYIVAGGKSSAARNSIALADEVNKIDYIIYVSNGQLMMESEA